MVEEVFVNASAFNGFIFGTVTFILCSCAVAASDYLYELVHKYRLKYRERKHLQEGGE